MTNHSPLWTAARHPLARLLREVAAGSYPVADGQWIRVSPWSTKVQGVVAFTGHAVLAVSSDVSDDRLTELGVDGWDGAHDPRMLVELAGPRGWIDSPDVLLLAAGRGGGHAQAPLVARPDLGRHPCAAFARRRRQDVQVLGSRRPERRDVVMLSHGVAGLREISIAVDPDDMGTGHSVALLEAGLECVPENEVVAASVAPGNAASLRGCLRAGFAPVGGVQLFSDRPERA